MNNKEFEKSLGAIANSSLSEKERSAAIKQLVDNRTLDNKEPIDPYFKKYYLKITFVVFIFIMIGGLAWYSLDAIFNSNEVPKEGVAIVNLILGTLLGKSSDLFELIRNGQGKE